MTTHVTFLDVHYPRLSATRKRDSAIARRLGLRDYRVLAPGVLRFTYRDRHQAVQAQELVCHRFHDVTAGLVTGRCGDDRLVRKGNRVQLQTVGASSDVTIRSVKVVIE